MLFKDIPSIALPIRHQGEERRSLMPFLESRWFRPQSGVYVQWELWLFENHTFCIKKLLWLLLKYIFCAFPYMGWSFQGLYYDGGGEIYPHILYLCIYILLFSPNSKLNTFYKWLQNKIKLIFLKILNFSR